MRYASKNHLWGRRLLWAAVLCPFVYSSSKTADDISSGGLGALDILRGLGPIVLYVASLLVSGPLRKISGFGVGALVAFCLIALSSSIWSVDMRATLLKAIVLAVFYASIARLVCTYPSPEEALRGLVSMVHVLLAWIGLQLMLLPSLSFDADPVTGLRRLNSFLPSISANPLSYLCLMGIVAMALRIGPDWAVKRAPVRVLLVTLYVVELIATRTRSALGIGLLVVAASLVFAVRRRPFIVSEVVLVGAAATLVAYTQSSAISRFLVRGSSEQALTSLTGRTDIWRIAIDSWMLQPWQGYGYYAGHRLRISALLGNGLQSNLDSTWIETLVDVGLIGTCALVLGVLALSARLVLWRTEQWELKLWACISVSYGLIVSFVNPTLQFPNSNALLLGMVLIAGGSGVVVSQGSRVRSEGQHPAQGSNPLRSQS